MIEFLDSESDVIAVRVSHEVTGADLQAATDHLEQAMRLHGTVHVFAECHSLDGIQLTGLGAHIQRVLPLLGQLNRFGRVAIVADEAWIRGAARVESALLPHVTYRVFKPEDREEALRFVEGRG